MPLKADEVGSLVNVDFGILGRVQKLRCIRFHPVLHEGTRMACQHFYLRVVQFLEMCSYRRREDCIAFPALPFDAVNLKPQCLGSAVLRLLAELETLELQTTDLLHENPNRLHKHYRSRLRGTALDFERLAPVADDCVVERVSLSKRRGCSPIVRRRRP